MKDRILCSQNVVILIRWKGTSDPKSRYLQQFIIQYLIQYNHKIYSQVQSTEPCGFDMFQEITYEDVMNIGENQQNIWIAPRHIDLNAAR